MDLRATLGNLKYDQLMQGIVRGKYHLLLGAGASVGGSSRDGRPLPGADQLAVELASAFTLPAPGAGGLRRLYALAKQRQTADLADYMISRFTGTTPPGWMSHMVGLSWAQLWSLNVDDTVQRAYEASTDKRQSVLSISWTERHRTARPGLSELLLVHLHGKASRAHRPDEIVFDISSYVNAAQGQHRWHRIFGDVYPEEPFLIVGASLDSEIDLEAVLAQGHLSASAEHPSLIILKDVTPLQVEEYRSYGLDLVEGTAQAFFEAIAADYQTYLQELTDDEVLTSSGLPKEALSFLTQWQALKLGAPGRRDRRHDFLAGHDPEWEDILADRAMERDATGPLLKALTARLSAGNTSVQLVEAAAFTGKSALLLTLARALAEAGFPAYMYSGESAPDLEAVLWWVRRYPKTVLIIDDAADFARDVEALTERVRTSQVVARVLMAERTGRARHVRRTLTPGSFAATALSSRLTDEEVRRLLAVLAQNKRLGVITGKPHKQQFDYVARRHERELFSSMAALESGRGFVEKISDEYEALTGVQERDLLGVLAVTSWLGYGLPVTIVKQAVGLTAAELETRLSETALGDLLDIRRGRLQYRHRMFGAILVNSDVIGAEQRFELCVDLAEALAPHISPAAIQASTFNYRITRALMGQAALKQLLGGSLERVLDFYDRLEKSFEWNARFWEQRALSAADAGHFEAAYSWAKQAVTKREDSFTLNTVGTVLMRRAVAEARLGAWPTDTFEAAVASLEEARALEGSEAEYPYETFFNYTLRLAQAVPERDAALEGQLRSVWNHWYLRQLDLAGGPRRRIERDLRQTFAAWRVLFPETA